MTSQGKVLLVGGAGYLGSVLTAELLERGYAVKVLDRLYFGDDGLREVRDRVELIASDMRCVSPSILEDVEAVINVGGLSNDPTAEYNPKANYEMNTTASIHLAQLSARYGVRRYLYASSCSVYDNGVDVEDHDIIHDEDADIRPRAAYSGSKFAAERALLAMASPDFCPVILRKGTVFGYSPRMRYDLVVNTFVKDALSKGAITVHFGGEMWRPLIDVRDAARAYIACLRAERSKVSGQIFNVAYRNFRISELALRVREALRACDVRCEICVDYGYKGVRSYRVSAKKIERTLDFHPVVSVEESVQNMVEQVRRRAMTNYDDPKYYNIRWMRFLEEAQRIIGVTGSVFEANGHASDLRHEERLQAARKSE